MLKVSEVKRYLDEAFYNSVECLPKLAGGGSKAAEQGINVYLSQIRPFQKDFVDEMTEVIMGKQPEIGQSRFFETVNEKAQQVVSSSGIRTWVFSRYATKTSN